MKQITWTPTEVVAVASVALTGAMLLLRIIWHWIREIRCEHNKGSRETMDGDVVCRHCGKILTKAER